jgi:phosphoribosyl 1,2-cyclic phosphodiesterase
MIFTTIASGSSGNCSLLQANGTNILIDAGISTRRIAAALDLLSLNVSDLTAVLITHEHGDHIGGIKTLSRRYNIPLFASKPVAEHITNNYQLPQERISHLIPEEEIALGSVSITSFDTPHDSVQSLGFRLCCEGISMGYCTDLGYADKTVISGLRGVDACLIESNHDVDMLKYGSYPLYLQKRILSKKGHLSNRSCGELTALLHESGTRKFILAHLSRENNSPDKARTAVFEAQYRAGISPDEESVLVAPDIGLMQIEIHKESSQCSA